MDERILNKVCIYQQDPEKLLSCCKKFTLERIRNIRWRNRIYFRDNKIKIINCKDPKYPWFFECKELWLKDGKKHRDDIDHNTGITLPALIYKNGIKCWYKNGKLHCDDIGLTLPAIIYENGSKIWYKNVIEIEFDPNCLEFTKRILISMIKKLI
jgi:hypothetical protein